MREILFRGKRVGFNEWIEGYYFQRKNNECVEGFIAAQMSECAAEFKPVYPETVGQYTGLADKNGKKIFEGDILFCTREIGMGYREFRGKVVYKAPKFYVDCGNVVLSLDCDNGKPDFIIIGNIYDNPELLEG